MSAGKRHVRLSCAATLTLRGYFHMGCDCEMNSREQIAALGGSFHGPNIRVSHVIPLAISGATGQSIKVPAADWFRVIALLHECGLTLVGSAHTHPKMALFMSGCDFIAHNNLFARGVSIIINPQADECAGFDGQGRRLRITWS